MFVTSLARVIVIAVNFAVYRLRNPSGAAAILAVAHIMVFAECFSSSVWSLGLGNLCKQKLVATFIRVFAECRAITRAEILAVLLVVIPLTNLSKSSTLSSLQGFFGPPRWLLVVVKWGMLDSRPRVLRGVRWSFAARF